MTNVTEEVPIIVVLGAPNDERGQLLPTARARADAAFATWQRHSGSRLLLTGSFGAHFNATARPHSAYVADYLVARGLPADAIAAHIPSANTVEDADNTAAFLSATPPRPWRLAVVTSDFHLARARFLFTRAFGARAEIEMIAAPSGLEPEALVRALRHEAGAIARLTGIEA